MAKEMSKGGAIAAPSLGPSYGGAGTANKAECLLLQSKSTEVGWGVVHFYREGEETPSLKDVDPDTLGAEDGEEKDEQFTTVCIPAVPAYMSAGDFLGFVGEKWREDISHCRLVMTSKMNRYLALLKFRSGKRAKQWRQEFDGRVFNTMEVCSFLSFTVLSCLVLSCLEADLHSLKSATQSSCERSHLKPQRFRTGMNLLLQARRPTSQVA
jgi:BRCA1-associated protein